MQSRMKSFVFWLRCEAYGILVPQPGIEPVPPVLEAESQPLDNQGSSSERS